MSEGAFFQDLALLMVVAGVVAGVFSRLKWPKVLGYILAGVFMSEHTWGGSFLADAGSVNTIGQLGVVFLMFSMGLSFSAKDMKKIRAVALPAAVLDTVVMIWLGYVVGTRLFGWASVPSLFLGVAICDSATTLLAKVIGEMGWSSRPFAKIVLGTSVCEDIVCVGAIAVVTGFARGGGMSVGALFASLGWLFVFFLAVIVFGLVFVPRMLASVGRRNDDEALVLAILGLCFFVSNFAYRFDFSLALGAFLVGLIGASSDVRDRLSALVEPLKAMFAAVFFVSIGLLVDPAALFGHAPEILVVSAAIVAGKTFNVAFASLLTGQSMKTAVQAGFSLAQTGEFALMVAILYAGLAGDSDSALFPVAVGSSLLTTLLNPWMIRFSDRVGDVAERRLPERFRLLLASYHGWLEKIGASTGSPAFGRFRAAAIRLGVYAVLMVAVSALCALLPRFDYSRFSELVERHDEGVFFAAANLFCVALLPLIVPAARALGDEVAVLLGGEGNARWQVSFRPFVRFVSLVAVLAAFFVEWTMIAAALAPRGGYTPWVAWLANILAGVIGWKFFVKAGRRATQRFSEALTAEERREGLAKTMTVTIPEGTVTRLLLPANSPAVGATVVSLNIRAKTGASVVSVIRDGNITRNIGPDWEFRIGDQLVVLGDAQQVAALKDLLGITTKGTIQQ